MLKINIKTIPHNEQRYNTIGDWWWDKETINIRVSEMSDWKYEFLVSFHELFEVVWCKFFGVSQEKVDAFDLEFENKKSISYLEPGDDPLCPYRLGHFWATSLERIAASVLLVDWEQYENEVYKLDA